MTRYFLMESGNVLTFPLSGDVERLRTFHAHRVVMEHRNPEGTVTTVDFVRDDGGVSHGWRVMGSDLTLWSMIDEPTLVRGRLLGVITEVFTELDPLITGDDHEFRPVSDIYRA